VNYYQLRNEMENAGFNALATTLGIQELMNKQLIIERAGRDSDGDPCVFYLINEAGCSWIAANQETLTLKM
jgi:hypothetical protein